MNKTKYLIGAVAVTVLIIIIAFQNISSSAQFWILFQAKNASLLILIFLVAALGMLAGVMYTIFIQSMLDKKQALDHDEADSDF
jgi:uncharacterized integral membrane protein